MQYISQGKGVVAGIGAASFCLTRAGPEPHQNDEAPRVWLLLWEGKMMRLQLRLHLLSLPVYTVKIENFNILMRIWQNDAAPYGSELSYGSTSS
jgi:hypothetical protein